MFIVYILQNKNNKIYIGCTNNINRRLEEHNKTGTGFTSKHRPWNLKREEFFKTRKEAMEREKYLKTGVGRDWINQNIL